MSNNLTVFDLLLPKFKIAKPIRLIELFAGYGSQFMSLKRLQNKGLIENVESYKICEWAVKSIQAYKDVHFEDNKIDYSENLNTNEIIDFLFNKGISMNYNKPMELTQIKRLGEDKIRSIYNNIIATHNLVNISKVKGGGFRH